MEKQEFLALIDRYLAGNASGIDEQMLVNYYMSFQGMDAWDPVIEGLKKEALDRMLGKIQLRVREAQKPARVYQIKWIKYAAAAVVLFAIAGSYFLIRKPQTTFVVRVNKNDVVPGKFGATLKIGDSKTIMLDTAAIGQLAANLSKEKNGIIIGTAKEEAQYATLETPRGAKQEHLFLKDGTEVILNAGSSLTFPTAFTGNERVVSMTGEVYFKVVHNASMPFKVKVGAQVVEDIGTEFNIRAYGEEGPVKTTLVEGSIKIADKVLKPGEQFSNGQIVKADIEDATAWIFGKFKFGNSDLQTVMREIERVYNIETQYTGDTKQKASMQLGGGTYRNINLSEVLKVLELLTGLHFVIDGTRVIVSN